MTIFGLNGPGPAFEGVAFALSNGNVQLSMTTAGQFPTADAFPIDRWSCVELEILVSDNGSATLYVDGIEKVSETNIDTFPQGGYEAANLGILFAQGDQNGSVLIDEVAVSRTRISCLPSS